MAPRQCLTRKRTSASHYCKQVLREPLSAEFMPLARVQNIRTLKWYSGNLSTRIFEKKDALGDKMNFIKLLEEPVSLDERLKLNYVQ